MLLQTQREGCNRAVQCASAARNALVAAQGALVAAQRAEKSAIAAEEKFMKELWAGTSSNAPAGLMNVCIKYQHGSANACNSKYVQRHSHMHFSLIRCTYQRRSSQRRSRNSEPLMLHLPPAKGVPRGVIAELQRFLAYDIQPGGFLKAVIKRDYEKARNGADVFMLPRVPDIIAYVNTHVPENKRTQVK
jgi:hypothetical protein